MTALVLSALTGLAGAGVAMAVPTARPWLVATVSAATAFVTAAARPVLDRQTERTTVRAWRRLEAVGIGVGAKLVQMLAGSRTLIDGEYLATLAAAAIGWAAVNATLTDLDAIDRGIGATDGLTPVQRIRLRFVGGGLVATAGAAFGAVGLGGLLDLSRPALARLSPAPLVYFAVGIVALGLVARRSELRRWARDGAVVDADVPASWARSVWTVVAGVTLLAVAIHVTPTGISAVPVRGVAGAGRIGEWISERAAALAMAVEAGTEVQSGGEGATATSAPEFEPVEPVAPWLGDLALWTMLAALFASIIVRGARRAGEAFPDGPAGGFRVLLRIVWEVLRQLVDGVAGVLRRLIGRFDPPHGASDEQARVPDDGWTSSDPYRRRIGQAYRTAVDTVSVHHGPTAVAETPGEYARRVEDEPFGVVTRSFEEARYSDHVLDERAAQRAERASRSVEARHGRSG